MRALTTGDSIWRGSGEAEGTQSGSKGAVVRAAEGWRWHGGRAAEAKGQHKYVLSEERRVWASEAE